MDLISERPLPAHQVDHGQATARLLKARGNPLEIHTNPPSISYIFQLFVFSFWNKNKLLLLFLFLCSWWAGWLVALKSTGILQIWKSGKEMGDSLQMAEDGLIPENMRPTSSSNYVNPDAQVDEHGSKMKTMVDYEVGLSSSRNLLPYCSPPSFFLKIVGESGNCKFQNNLVPILNSRFWKKSARARSVLSTPQEKRRDRRGRPQSRQLKAIIKLGKVFEKSWMQFELWISQVASVFREKRVLQTLSEAEPRSPFIVQLMATFQDENHLYFVLSYAKCWFLILGEKFQREIFRRSAAVKWSGQRGSSRRKRRSSTLLNYGWLWVS